jgi:membrane protein
MDIAASVLIIWMVMFIAYAWVPNTNVQFRAAMLGALITAILLEAGKRLLGLYTSHALTLNQLYGSLGFIPLFMFWVYTMWIFVLFGLEVSAIVQVLRGRSPAILNRGEGTPGMIEPSIVLRVLQEAGKAFDDGTPLEVDQVANQLGLPITSTRVIIERLADRGFLVRLQTADQFALSRPLEKIQAREILDIGFNLADESTRSSPPALLDKLRDAQCNMLEGMTVRAALEPDSS